jgi:hypothetical protein
MEWGSGARTGVYAADPGGGPRGCCVVVWAEEGAAAADGAAWRGQSGFQSPQE